MLREKGAAQPRPNQFVAVPSHIAHLRFTLGIASPVKPALVCKKEVDTILESPALPGLYKALFHLLMTTDE
jgi:hypothetical protein